jgi:AbrB family looped-hinge helix DNA binding protein
MSAKNQIVIPKSARKKLGLSPGDELVVRTEREVLVLKPRPKNYTRHMQGLHKNVWQNVDVDAYIEKERKDCSIKPTDLRRLSGNSRR